MAKQLPPRPNLDHLRRQAKALLAALAAGDPEAVATFRQHLPAVKGKTAAQIRKMTFRLADAQSAIARKAGFASWPKLARHVEQLRALEGTWAFTHLEVDGATMPAAGLAASRIVIDGDRFRTESPEAIYEGIFNINVEAQPHEIEIEFVAGPEAGNRNYGIFRLDGDRLEFCLDMNGKPCPREFRTAPGSGHAYERLTRTSAARPEHVAGGTPPVVQPAPTVQDRAGFEYVESATLKRLHGEWTPVRIVHDGRELPAAMLRTGMRRATQNEVKIVFAGQTMIHALVRIDESTDPIHIDYYSLGGPMRGTVQHGIMQWIGDDADFNMAPHGQPRPEDFTCPPGSGRILSQWRRKG